MAAAALALVAYGVFALVVLGHNGWNPSVFVTAGSQFSDVSATPRQLVVMSNSAGYDAQFYYRLALRPFSTEPVEVGIKFDYPVYRSQRIVYPILVWLVTGANPAATAWAMLCINVASIMLVAIFGSLLIEDSRWALAGAAVAFYPGFLLTVSRDLVEILEIAFILSALYALRSNRAGWLALLLSLAVLTKETALFFAGALMILALAGSIPRRFGVSALVAVSSHFVWKLLLFHAWRLPVTFVTGEHFAPPFSGFFGAFIDALKSPVQNALFLTEATGIILFTCMVLAALRASSAPVVVRLAWFLYAALLFVLAREFWVEDWAFLRAGTDYGVCGVLIALSSKRWRFPALALLSSAWLMLAGQLVLNR